MQYRITTVLIAAALLVWSVESTAAALGDIGIGGAQCSEVKRAIKRDWMDVQRFFRPHQKDLKKPKRRDFFCVSPQYTNGLLPERPYTSNLTCFVNNGTRFCCDSSLSACAGVQ